MHRSYPADLPPQPEKAARLAQAGRLIALCLILGCNSSYAEPYTWTDAHGRVHFGDKPPQGGKATPVEIRPNIYSAPMLSTHNIEAGTAQQDIVMYSTKRCGYCRKARAFFASRNLSYTEYDVETSPRGRSDYKKLAGRGVPIILVGEQRMNGYSETALNSMLRNAGFEF